ncbi:MAG: PDZ domain-containing protein, partial [Actinobacteria bacterium]|nr:PDZ domain-containing protein [Actinomycetota bacterium]
GLVVAFLPSGYLVDSPGQAIDTRGLVTVPKSVTTYSHPGGFRFVTVSETDRPVFAQALAGWLDPDSDVFRRTDVVGDVPSAAETRYQLVLMNNAKLSAIYHAMAVLGLSAKMTGGGVFVDQIVAGSPADHRLAIGDTITAIDNSQIVTVDDIARFMADAKPGQKVRITVDRLGVSLNEKVDVTLGSTTRDGKKIPFLGIYMETRPNYTFPFDVGFDTGDIGGPSAGLALTLSLIQKLSPKSLTGGREIAVTGTMLPGGEVGPIGGIRQKVAAVEASGTKIFLVPVDNAADARKAAGKNLRIIPVKSLDDALAKLRELDGSSAH